MDSLKLMQVFARVAQRSSFAAAGRDLRMSPASVTRHVAAIESQAGVRLLDRTTRKVHMTEAGRIYLERCLECLQAFGDADAALSELAAGPRGQLRVAAPFDLSHRHLPSLITSFMKTHPEVSLDVHLSNRVLDMVDEGIDVYLRITNSLDSRYVARKLATTRIALWGAPAYFRKHGRPRKLADLAAHRFTIFDEPPCLDEVVFERSGKRTTVKLQRGIVSNSGDVLLQAVREGLVLGLLPSFNLPKHCGKDLEPVMLEWSLGKRGLYAVYPHRRFVPSKVRAFVDALRSALGDPDQDPFWPADIPVPDEERG